MYSFKASIKKNKKEKEIFFGSISFSERNLLHLLHLPNFI